MWRFHWCQLATILHHSCLKISMQSSARLWSHISFWAKKNKKYLKIAIYLKHAFKFPFQASVSITLKPSVDLLCKWFLHNDNSANLIHHLLHILFYNDKTANLRHHLLHILFSIYWRQLHPFPQVLNQGRLISKNITIRI